MGQLNASTSGFRLPIAALAFAFLCSAELHAVPPVAPSDLRGYVSAATSLVLVWSDNSTDETGFDISYTVNGGGPTSLPVGSGTQSTTGTVSLMLTVAANTTYTFAVRSSKGSAPVEYSTFSNTITIRTAAFDPPGGLSATPLADFSVLLMWVDNAATEAGFFVESRKLPSGTFAQLGSLGTNVTSVLIPSLEPSSQYEFRLRAFTGSAGSPTSVTAYSNTAPVTTAAMAAPTSLVVTPSSTSPYTISFAWTDNTTAESGYEIEYRKQGTIPFTRRATTAANATSATVPEWEPGTAYEFRARAVRGTSVSAYSAIVPATTKDGFSSPRYVPATVGSSFTYQLATISQAVRTGWNVTGLPDGLSFDNGTGIISGVPATAGVSFVPMTATFAGGGSHNQNLELRVLNPPEITTPVPKQTLQQGGNTSIALDASFTDPDTDSVVRLATSKGNIDIALYDTATPQTVANFRGYVNRGDYNNVIFHRSPLGFVLQGGGYRTYAAPDVFEHIPTVAPVPNEPGISNLTGTVAMAKVGGDPDSATSEFFVNVEDNSGNLDFQNGGFTVFGRVSAPTLASTVTTIAGLDRNNYPIQQHTSVGNSSGTFRDFPIDQFPAPTSIDQSKVVKINSVSALPVLSFAILSNSNPAAATASIAGNNLQINALAPGMTIVTVSATDVDGNAASQPIEVEVQQLFSQWATGQGLAPGQSGPGDNPDGDSSTNLKEFAFLGNPKLPDDSTRLPTFALTPSGPAKFAEITFPVRKYAANLVYTVEASSTLLPGSWTTLWTSTDGFGAPAVTSAVDQSDRTIVTVRDTSSSPTASRRFLHVIVQLTQ